MEKKDEVLIVDKRRKKEVQEETKGPRRKSRSLKAKVKVQKSKCESAEVS